MHHLELAGVPSTDHAFLGTWDFALCPVPFGAVGYLIDWFSAAGIVDDSRDCERGNLGFPHESKRTPKR
jgi:hypothetical protein